MQKTESRVFQINDFIGWYKKGEINLNSPHQWDRKSDFTQSQKFYAIDNAIKGYPLPQIFLIKQLNIEERKITRHILCGAKLLTILFDFYENKFKVQHNKDYPNSVAYEDLSVEQKLAFLNTDLSVVMVLVPIEHHEELNTIFSQLID